MSLFNVVNSLDGKIRIGYLFAKEVRLETYHEQLEQEFDEWTEKRKNPLHPEEDQFRLLVRDMLRTKSYKPTGRGKPASEYLLRTALEGQFPRINVLADINNYISLKYLVPISLWDTDKITADYWLFRTGKPGEQFVFNPAGQTIDLEGLATGFAVSEETETPAVTPVKDCHRTKTGKDTRNIASAIYFPAQWNREPELETVLEDFSGLLQKVCAQISSGIA